jgi:alpha-L-arabinofuranosidase
MTARITIHANKAGPTVSPLLYGIFFEEINRAGDGGLLAEMLQNRCFEDDANTPVAWAFSGPVQASLDRKAPLNHRNPTSLRLDFSASGGRITNSGFSRQAAKDHAAYAGGLALRVGEKLRFSLHQRGRVALEAKLEAEDGKVLAHQNLPGPWVDWRKVELELTPTGSDPRGRLVLTGKSKGTVWIDQVSLTPVDTWHGHGLRRDLAEMVAAMKPAFVRFPGGCYVEGKDRPNALRWKDTVGDVTQRRGVANHWGYQTTGAFGVYEFFQWCEDLGAEPLYVINCGMGHGFAIPMGEMQPWVQDALDLVEYARGPSESRWGALRAAAGHPAPFPMRYLEIGNENGGAEYEERYALFYDALKAKYPDLSIIANLWTGGIPQTRPVEIQDDHYYLDADGFKDMADRYATYDRKGPKIYVGEYAVVRGCGEGNLGAALGEAAFMTGLEANSDLVVMASYAPLFVHPAWKAWNPNAIVFDESSVYGTPSYHCQSLFAAHRCDVLCPIEIDLPTLPYQPPRGRFGVGTWATEAEFKDITFTTLDGKQIFASDFSAGLQGWQSVHGNWKVQNGALCQTDRSGHYFVTEIAGSDWGDGVFAVKARKIAGTEGFQIQFQAESAGQQRVWNLGGWGNLQHGLQCVSGEPSIPGTIEANRWYEVRIELSGPRVRCYLDGKLLQEVVRTNPKRLFAVAGRTRDGKEMILKVVNSAAEPLATTIHLNGVQSAGPDAQAWVMQSDSLEDENSFEHPLRVAPVETKLHGLLSPTFEHAFPARSITVIRIPVVP